MKKEITANVQTIHVNLSPLAFHLYSCHYLKCKSDFKVSKFSPIPYFLLCRSIELEIKSRHLERKNQRQVKKDYGHNLKKAYDKLDLSEKILTDDEVRVLEEASLIYKNKGFEYFSPYDALTGYRKFPDLNVLENVAKKLVENSSLHDDAFKRDYLF